MSTEDIPLEVSVQQAKEMLTEGAAVVDVREPWEFDQGHIEGAIPVPLQTLPANIGDIPTDRPVVINCHHGGRSMRAVQFLREQGHTQVTNLAGGLDKWSLEIDPSIARY